MKFNQQEKDSESDRERYKVEIQEDVQELSQKCRNFASHLQTLNGKYEEEKGKNYELQKEIKNLQNNISEKQEDLNNQNILQANLETRLKIAKEEGIRQGRREGIMDSKMNEYITKYKQEVEQQAEKIVELTELSERLQVERNKLVTEARQADQVITTERNLQKNLSKEVEQLVKEVQKLKSEQFEA